MSSCDPEYNDAYFCLYSDVLYAKQLIKKKNVMDVARYAGRCSHFDFCQNCDYLTVFLTRSTPDTNLRCWQ